MLDIGTGSGILSIASVKLGAKKALGIDIDQVAVETAIENAQVNELQNEIEFIQGNFVEQVSGEYDVVLANIVADAIIYISKDVKKLLSSQGVYITSGIIDTRADEVEKALLDEGFKIKGKKQEKGWVSFCAVK